MWVTETTGHTDDACYAEDCSDEQGRTPPKSTLLQRITQPRPPETHISLPSTGGLKGERTRDSPKAMELH